MRQFSTTILSVLAVCSLGGCATASFAPPPVELAQARKLSNCEVLRPAGSGGIDADQAGAHALTDNFIYAYRCAQRDAADGRQIFQIPSFLALIVASLGPTFGASADARIAMAGYGAALDRGNAYYAPKAKAAILDHGLDALLCIKAEQVGVDYFDSTQDAVAAADAAFLERQIEQLANTRTLLVPADFGALSADAATQRKAQIEDLDNQIAQLAALKARRARAAVRSSLLIQRQTAGGSIRIDVERQYYDMVASALLSVERVIGKRLSEAGSPDTEAFAALLKKIADEAAAADQKRDAAKPSNPASLALFGNDPAQRDQAYIEASIEALQKKLQACVLRAKMT